MEKIVHSIFNSFFQTKRSVKKAEKYAVVISIIGLVAAYSYILVVFKS